MPDPDFTVSEVKGLVGKCFSADFILNVNNNMLPCVTISQLIVMPACFNTVAPKPVEGHFWVAELLHLFKRKTGTI